VQTGHFFTDHPKQGHHDEDDGPFDLYAVFFHSGGIKRLLFVPGN
jgi:hypothetical protein